MSLSSTGVACVPPAMSCTSSAAVPSSSLFHLMSSGVDGVDRAALTNDGDSRSTIKKKKRKKSQTGEGHAKMISSANRTPDDSLVANCSSSSSTNTGAKEEGRARSKSMSNGRKKMMKKSKRLSKANVPGDAVTTRDNQRCSSASAGKRLPSLLDGRPGRGQALGQNVLMAVGTSLLPHDHNNSDRGNKARKGRTRSTSTIPMSCVSLPGNSTCMTTSPPQTLFPSSGKWDATATTRTPKPPPKRFVVQANAYHCSFVQAMMAARGPEWKHSFRSLERLSASDVAQCAFVWVKYEFIKGLPDVPRARLDADTLAALERRTVSLLLRQRTAAAFRSGEGGDESSTVPSSCAHVKPLQPSCLATCSTTTTASSPMASPHVLDAAVELLNAKLVAESPEEPVPTARNGNLRPLATHIGASYNEHPPHVTRGPASSPVVATAVARLVPSLNYLCSSFPTVQRVPIVGCFGNAAALWRKHLLYRFFKQYCDNCPQLRGSVRERMPITFEFDLNNDAHEGECVTFMESAMQSSCVRQWMAKATGSANGNGFYLSKDPRDVVRFVTSQERKAGGESDYWVVQEFVERMPLLFGDRRFHMKVHAVMIATAVGIDVYVYKRQRLQCCAVPYDEAVMDPLSYIGNWGQQRNAKQLDHAKYVTLLEDIRVQYPKLVPAWNRAKTLIAEAVEAAWLCGREHFAFSPGCFELMGWDFVIEECSNGDWRPLLIEANHRPGFGSERAYLERLIQCTADLALAPVHGPPPSGSGDVEAPWDHVRTIVISDLHRDQPTATASQESGASPSSAGETDSDDAFSRLATATSATP